MNLSILHELGLGQNEAFIYGLLLENGSMKASDIENLANIGRGNVYNTLTKLQKDGLVLPIEGKQTRYQPVNPAELRKLLDKRLTEAKSLETLFQAQLPTLTSAFNLSTGKPAIQVFEGVEGVRQVLQDSLTTKEEILTIVDPDAISEEILDVESRYIRKRVDRKISKRVIMPDTPKAREWLKQSPNPYTTTRLVPKLSGNFKTATEIYDHRLSFITLSGEHIISILINDKDMAALQRVQFEFLWQNGIEHQAASANADDTVASDTNTRRSPDDARSIM